jgi:PhoH-like ATPase
MARAGKKASSASALPAGEISPGEVTLAADTKIYLLDTSVLLHSPEAIFAFGDNEVVLPLVVLDELDNFKKGSTELNRHARWVINHLDNLRSLGPVSMGVALPGGGRLRVDVDAKLRVESLIPAGFSHNVDNRILATALALNEDQPGRKVVVVTKDINMRVKAEALGLYAEDYLHDQIVEISEMYSGHREVEVDENLVERALKEQGLPASEINVGNRPLAPSEFVQLKGAATALTRYDSVKDRLNLLRELRHDIWGIRPLTREQRFALEILLDDSVPLVTISGKAGTGKTILAIATGLHKVCNEKSYRRLAIYRPVIPMGRDLGYLPGTEQEKLAPWMQPIFDNLEFLLSQPGEKGSTNAPSAPGAPNGQRKGGMGRIEYLQENNILDIRALTYIRGRSLPQQFIIVDEAQNLTPHEAKTIITRAGQGTKLIFTGDPYQIDHPYLDSTSNGLTHVVQKFKDHPIAAHITLVKGERSPLAEIASVLMES